MEKIRLNKYFSEMGILSRRACDLHTEQGHITVNGERATLGMKIDGTETICFMGKPISKKKPETHVYALNKPKGVVTTTRSFPGEQNVTEFFPEGESLYPIGRLDKDSTGLLLLTNDGALTKAITDASLHHEKEYEVIVNREMTDSFLKRMERGILLRDLNKTTSRCKIVRTGEKKFKIILTQGLNRQIRRMCETLGYEVVSLHRIRIMNILLGDLKPGALRKIQGAELTELKRLAKEKG